MMVRKSCLCFLYLPFVWKTRENKDQTSDARKKKMSIAARTRISIQRTSKRRVRRTLCTKAGSPCTCQPNNLISLPLLITGGAGFREKERKFVLSFELSRASVTRGWWLQKYTLLAKFMQLSRRSCILEELPGQRNRIAVKSINCVVRGIKIIYLSNRNSSISVGYVCTFLFSFTRVTYSVW